MAKKTNYSEQIKHCDEKIAFYQQRKKKLKTEQEAVEQAEMLAILRENKVSKTDLTEILSDYIGLNKNNTDKEIANA